ncbi:MAG: RNase P/RNase MRP subunit POP5 [Candidatus Alkanophagales archaeon MCA70_species_2]|nr:RNase P/RNase MRP subunit POP5 [Candidatus Alkanophaga liquidiphilum]
MTRLLPSLREKKRYLVFELLSEGEVERGEFLKELWGSLYSLFGETGASRCRLWLIDFEDAGVFDDFKMHTGIVRCAHTRTEDVRAALACITSVGGRKVSIRVKGISGTIKAARRKFFSQRAGERDECCRNNKRAAGASGTA